MITPNKKIRNRASFLRKYYTLTTLLNLATCALAIIYFLGFYYSIFTFILGTLFISTIFVNLGLVVFSDRYIDYSEKGKLGRNTNILNYIYLLYLAIGILTFYNSSGVIVLSILSKIIFFGLIGFSIMLCYSQFINNDVQKRAGR